MPVDITLNPIGRSFIPTVVGDPRFAQKGYLVGDSAVGYYWVVLDPRRHPLFVWRKRYQVNVFNRDDYEKTALWFGMPGFSNGPMMELPDSKHLIDLLKQKVGIWTLIGLIGGAVVGAILSGGALVLPIIMSIVAGGATGALAGVFRAFMEWLRGGTPYGFVKGDSEAIDDPGMGYNGNLVSFGRGPATDFSSYRLSMAPTASGFSEAMGGLIPLVISFVPRTTTPGTAFNQAFANLNRRGGISGWALIPLGYTGSATRTPLDDGLFAGPLTENELQGVDLMQSGGGQLLDGVIMVAAKRPGAGELATYFASVGASDAVAMDGSDSVIMGSLNDMFIGGLTIIKDGIQKYGFGTK